MKPLRQSLLTLTLILAGTTAPLTAHNPGSAEIAQCTALLEENPDDVATRRKRAELFIAFGDHQDGIKDCEVLVKKCPGKAWVYTLRGRAWGIGGRCAEAEKDFTRAIKIDPKARDAYILRSAILKELGRLGEAAADLTRALAMERQYSLHYDRAEIYMAMGRYDLAVKDYEAFLNVQPSSVLYENLAKACLLAKDLKKALHYADKAVEKTKTFAWNYLLRARILKKLGRPEDGEKDLDVALARANEALTSEYGPSIFDLLLRAEIRLEMNDAAGALKDAQEAVELEPEAVEAYLRRAAVYERMGKKKLAREDREKAVALKKKFEQEMKKG